MSAAKIRDHLPDFYFFNRLIEHAMTSEAQETTLLLNQAASGDREAASELLDRVYTDMRRVAEKQVRLHDARRFIDPTALVHEAFMKLIDQKRVDWAGRTHFFAIGSEAIRRALVDTLRYERRLKRGGGRQRVELKDDLAGAAPEATMELLALDEALENLAKTDPRAARVVELRFFGGLTVEEAATAIGVSKRTVEGDWTMARAWLRKALATHTHPSPLDTQKSDKPAASQDANPNDSADDA